MLMLVAERLAGAAAAKHDPLDASTCPSSAPAVVPSASEPARCRWFGGSSHPVRQKRFPVCLSPAEVAYTCEPATASRSVRALCPRRGCLRRTVVVVREVWM